MRNSTTFLLVAVVSLMSSDAEATAATASGSNRSSLGFQRQGWMTPKQPQQKHEYDDNEIDYLLNNGEQHDNNVIKHCDTNDESDDDTQVRFSYQYHGDRQYMGVTEDSYLLRDNRTHQSKSKIIHASSQKTTRQQRMAFVRNIIVV